MKRGTAADITERIVFVQRGFGKLALRFRMTGSMKVIDATVLVRVRRCNSRLTARRTAATNVHGGDRRLRRKRGRVLRRKQQ